MIFPLSAWQKPYHSRICDFCFIIFYEFSYRLFYKIDLKLFFFYLIWDPAR